MRLVPQIPENPMVSFSAVDKRSPSRQMRPITRSVGTWLNGKHVNFVLITEKQYLLQISPNNSGNQEIIWATQFSTMGGPVGDPWI